MPTPAPWDPTLHPNLASPAPATWKEDSPVHGHPPSNQHLLLPAADGRCNLNFHESCLRVKRRLMRWAHSGSCDLFGEWRVLVGVYRESHPPPAAFRLWNGLNKACSDGRRQPSIP